MNQIIGTRYQGLIKIVIRIDMFKIIMLFSLNIFFSNIKIINEKFRINIGIAKI